MGVTESSSDNPGDRSGGRLGERIAAHVSRDPADPIQTGMQLASNLLARNDTARATDVYMSVANTMFEQGRPLEAVAIYHAGLTLDMSRFTDDVLISIIHRLGDGAFPLVSRVVENHLIEGRSYAALGLLNRVANATPDRPEVQRQLARSYLNMGRKNDAIECLWQSAQLFEANGDVGSLITVAKQIVELDAMHRKALYALARAYLRVGDPDQALEAVSTVLHVDERDKEAQECLVGVFLALDRTELALSAVDHLVQQLRAAGQVDELSAFSVRAGQWSPDDETFMRGLDEILRTRRAHHVHAVPRGRGTLVREDRAERSSRSVGAPRPAQDVRL